MSSDKDIIERRKERMRGRNSKREHHQIEDRNFSVNISPLNNGRLIASTSDNNEGPRDNMEEEIIQSESKKNTQSTTSNTSNVSVSSINSPPGTQEIEPSLSYNDTNLRTSTSTRYNQTSDSIPQVVTLPRHSHTSNEQSLISPLSQNRVVHNQQPTTSPEISPVKTRPSLASQDDISSSPSNTSPLPLVENHVIKPKFIDNSELDKSSIAPKTSISSTRTKIPTARSKFKSISKAKPTSSSKIKATSTTPIEKIPKKASKPATPEKSPEKEIIRKVKQIKCYKLPSKSLLTTGDEDENENDNTFQDFQSINTSFRSRVNPFDISLQNINKLTKRFERQLPIELAKNFQCYQNTLNAILINFSDTWDTQTSIQQEIKATDKQNTILKDELLRLKKEFGEVNRDLCRLKADFKRDETAREQLESCHKLTSELQRLSTLSNKSNNNLEDINSDGPDISKWFTLQSNLKRLRSRLGLASSGNNTESEKDFDLENCNDLLNRLRLTNEDLKLKLKSKF